MIRLNSGETVASPFATGASVSGKQFVGRGEYLKKGVGRLKSGNSFAICGIRRIGKTSLARKLLYETENWKASGWIVVEITLQECTSYFDMWHKIIDEIAKDFSESKRCISPNVNYLLNAVKRTFVFEEMRDNIQALFKRLMLEGIRTMLLIDEFDYVVEVFGDDSKTRRARVMSLRTLAEPNSGLTFIIVSRRKLEQLERSACDGSTFHQSFHTEKLIGFNKKERALFRDYMEGNGIKLDDEEWQILFNHAGRSPFMFSKAAEALLYADEEQSAKDILADFEKEHIGYFRDLVTWMRKDGDCLKHMVQIFIGPKYELTEYGIDELKLYGYIWLEHGSDRFETISPLFERFLKSEVRRDSSLDFWPLASSTENQLRNFISQRLHNCFGAEWEKELKNEAQRKMEERKNNSKVFFIDLGRVEKYRTNRGERLLDQCNFMEYYNIISHYRQECFADIWTESRISEFKQCCFKIYNARNPFAHSNNHLLTTIEIREADLACEKILESISN